MDYTNENRNASAVYVEPVLVEDRPLPVHLKVWEAVKCASRLAWLKIRNSRRIKSALRAAAVLIALAAGPVWLVLTLLASAGKTRRTAGAAY